MRAPGILAAACIGLAMVPVSPDHDWTQFGFDAGRSGASTAQSGIDETNVRSLRRQQVTLEGTVDSSAIYLSGVFVQRKRHDTFFVTTTYGKTIALDANDGSVLWTYTPNGYASWVGSYQITNATPVADADDNRFIYAASPDGHVQKLSVATGGVIWNTAVTSLPKREKIASSLNYFNGRVIVTTGGYVGDAPPYQGHVVLLGGASGQIQHVWNSLCSDRTSLMDPRTCAQSDSAIWGRAGAVVDVSTGHLLVATGNGRWDGHSNWGDATLELDSSATQILGAYTPSNTGQLDAQDLDVGSTSPVLLGGDYVLQGGKDGRMRLLSLQQMRVAPSRTGGELQIVSTPSGTDLFTAPAVLHSGADTWVFAADNGGTAAWTFSNGRLQEQWQNHSGGTSPLLAGGLLYVYDPHGGLRVYKPTTGAQVATLDCGPGHWNSPIVVDGRIALPEGNANSQRSSGTFDIWRMQN